jgi:hypothetical protein
MLTRGPMKAMIRKKMSKLKEIVMSKELTTIVLREAVNGYSVICTTSHWLMPIDIVCDERIEGLKAIKTWVEGELLLEYKKREYHASDIA